MRNDSDDIGEFVAGCFGTPLGLCFVAGMMLALFGPLILITWLAFKH